MNKPQTFSSHPAYNATWLVTAPWAHPIWKQYLIMLVDLTTDTGHAPTILKQGVTHEFHVIALDPAITVRPDKPFEDQEMVHLTPHNYGYQFAAATNEAAEARIQSVVDDIDARRISPDTDHRSVWNRLFQDGASLYTNALEAMLATKH